MKHYKISPMTAICGQYGMRKEFTEDIEEVECKMCLKILTLGDKAQKRRDEYLIEKSTIVDV